MTPWRVEAAAEAGAFVAVEDFMAVARGASTSGAVPDASTVGAETVMPGGRILATRLPVALAGPAIP
jgi:hypothetical protein